MAATDERRMKPGPWKQLLERAARVGIDTTGYDDRSSSANRLRQRVVEKEQKRAGEPPVTEITQRRVKLADIPKMGQTSIDREKVCRDWTNYMLRYVNHLSGGDEPQAPLDRLTSGQLNQAQAVARSLVEATR